MRACVALMCAPGLAEVASFLHQVQADSLSINEMTAMAKPKPVAQQPGQQRRTGSGTGQLTLKSERT